MDMAKKYQYPIYPGEKFGGDSIIFNYINKELPMVILRERITVKSFDGDTITNIFFLNIIFSPRMG